MNAGTKSEAGHEAEDKTLPGEDAKLVNNEIEIKFLSGENKKNGDAKIDLGELKTAFVGMGKEELMRYAKDPFWVKLRWVLFILFWLVWVLMLVGAIAIIIRAPKCSAPRPLKWWEQGPLAEIDAVKTDETLLKQLKADGYQGVILAPHKKDDSYELFNIEDESIVKSIISAGLKVIVDLNPVNTLQWFNASQNLQEPWVNYYIWRKGVTTNGIESPPNQWLSPKGGSAWKYSSKRKEYYLAQMGEPDLNFREKKVIDEFSKVIGNWLKAGASGIRLSNVYRLLVDPQFRNEDVGSILPPHTHDQYEFYTHKYTKNQEDISNVLVQWRKIVMNMTNNEGVLTLLDDIDTLTPYVINDTLLVDIPRHTEVFNLRKHNTSAVHLLMGLESAKSVLGRNVRPSWKYQTGPKDIPEDVLQMVTFLLPGTPIINVTESTRSANFNALVQLRESPVVLFGNFTIQKLANNTIFGYSRDKSGQPGYLVMFNPTANVTAIDVSTVPNMSEDLTVTLISSNYNVTGVKPKTKVGAKEVKLSPKSAIVLTYVQADAME